MNVERPSEKDRMAFQRMLFFAIQRTDPMMWIDPVLKPKLEDIFTKSKSESMLLEYWRSGEPDLMEFIGEYVQLPEGFSIPTNNQSNEVRA